MKINVMLPLQAGEVVAMMITVLIHLTKTGDCQNC